MFPSSTSSERLDIVVLILFLVFFVDPFLPSRILKTAMQLLSAKKVKEKE